ncbi:two-component sensor histidine kinase [Streptomyces sp. WAC 06738]|uniref:sensor histidine kinase n=1 Tax=Streptomyces sp. WAC 06738 TaxID=2203210 RepID=UPI000F6FFD23|nr:HAMP domain-containing sensor histidine kinase [Streptomyces sp. WAC 06738]AZM47181.1 two-component sensor histidine kinase [Streptomyces sp. WAC 06738]
MRSPFSSVRAKAAVGATAVVALALVAAGVAVLLVLRSNLHDQTELRAEVNARRIATELSNGIPLADLDLPEDNPTVVRDDRDRMVLESEDLGHITGAGDGPTTPPRDARTESPPPSPAPTPTQTPTPSPTGDPDDSDDSGDSGDDNGGDRDDADDDADDDAEDAEDAADDAADEANSDDSDDSGNDSADDSDDSGNDSADDSGDSGDDDPAPRRGEVEDEAERHTGTAVLDGERADYRFAGLKVTTPDGQTYTVWAGVPLDTEQNAVGTVGRAMLAGLVPLLAVVAGVTWLVTRRALRPVEGIRGEMAAITASTDLSRRVPEPASRDEVARLARTTNETLTALEKSVERQRRFVADASHELRSPIASLRTQLEVAAAHPELLDLDGAVADTVRLQHLAADLLLLARLDAGEEPLGKPVALGALVRETVERRHAEGQESAGPGREVAVVTGEVADATVAGSRGQLERVLGNLLNNAVRHAAGRVDVSVRREGAWAVLDIADDGAGVPAADRERIFERFVRLDDARSRDEGGAGLGLAIVRDVVVRHGGTIGVGEAAGGGALFTVRLPLSGPPAGD